MLVDIKGDEIQSGDECIVTINNRGLTRIIITRFTKTTVYYDVVPGYPNLAIKNFLLLKTANLNLFKL